MKFTVQWFLTLGLAILTLVLLVRNAYTPGSTVVATALVFAFAPMIAGLTLKGLWDTRQEFHTSVQFFCVIVGTDRGEWTAVMNCLYLHASCLPSNAHSLSYSWLA